MGIELVEQMVEILSAGITGYASAFGEGINALVSGMFVATGETTGLSIFGSVILAFAGVGLAIGLCAFVLNWLTSFGN